MLVGRHTEAARLIAVLAAGRSAAVVGPAGIGKTALLRHVAHACGRRVREGGGLASLAWRPYLPVARAVGDLDLDLAGDPAFVAEAAVAAIGDGLLLLDDLTGPTRTPSRCCRCSRGGCRCSSRSAAATSAPPRRWPPCNAADLELHAVEPLPPADAVALVRGQRPDLADDAVAAVVQRGAGNPLLLSELSATGELPATLQLVLGARLRRCGPAARRSMALLGLLARPAPAALLGDGVPELVDAGLVEAGPAEDVGGDLVAARHALLADAALDGLARTCVAPCTASWPPASTTRVSPPATTPRPATPTPRGPLHCGPRRRRRGRGSGPGTCSWPPTRVATTGSGSTRPPRCCWPGSTRPPSA